MPEWLNCLRDRGMKLIADADASVAARLEAERTAEEKYGSNL